jgi:hypothetical protein
MVRRPPEKEKGRSPSGMRPCNCTAPGGACRLRFVDVSEFLQFALEALFRQYVFDTTPG